jgi:hypothetical protein
MRTAAYRLIGITLLVLSTIVGAAAADDLSTRLNTVLAHPGLQGAKVAPKSLGRIRMSNILDRLTTPEDCEKLAKNVEHSDRELAIQARRRAVELRAATHGGKTSAEQEAIRAVYAYEEGLKRKRGRNIRAARTWQMIARYGIIGAVERAVNRRDETSGFLILREMGMEDFAFEVVVLKYPELFSHEARERSRERLEKWRA